MSQARVRPLGALRLPRPDPRQSVPGGGAVDGAARRRRAGRGGLLAAGAGLPFLAFVAWRQQRGRPGPGWGLVALVVLGGLFFAADLAAWHEGILRTKLANATLFGNFASFLFAVYGFVLLRTLPRPAQLLALLLAAAGTLLLLGGSYELSRAHFTGDLLALLAGLFYTFYLIAVDRARRTMKPWPVLAIATAGGTIPLLLFALALGEQVMPHDWTMVILLSVSSQLIGQGLLVYAMGHVSPVVTGLVLPHPADRLGADRLARLRRAALGRRRHRRAADLRRFGADPAAGAKACNERRPGSLIRP